MPGQDEVTNNEASSRYELPADGELAIAAYRLDGEVIAFTHTEVPEALEGQGIGSRLIRGALEDVRQRGLKVRPLCSFVRGYMERHPETRDLLA
jgi:predicted GNAT family acetyltransferase